MPTNNATTPTRKSRFPPHCARPCRNKTAATGAATKPVPNPSAAQAITAEARIQGIDTFGNAIRHSRHSGISEISMSGRPPMPICATIITAVNSPIHTHINSCRDPCLLSAVSTVVEPALVNASAPRVRMLIQCHSTNGWVGIAGEIGSENRCKNM